MTSGAQIDAETVFEVSKLSEDQQSTPPPEPAAR